MDGPLPGSEVVTRAELLKKLAGKAGKKPQKGMPKRSEGEIQAGIISYLAIRGDMYFWRQNSGVFSPRPGTYVRAGVKGVSDIICVWAPYGRFVGVECKKLGEGPDEDQIAWGKSVTKMGGLYIVAWSPEDVRASLEANVRPSG